MPKPKFHVTYEIVTPESAEYADAAERGFVLADGSHVELESDVFGAAAGIIKDQCSITLREAVGLVGNCENSGSWFSEIDGNTDYQTAEEERRSLHPPHNITTASYDRIARVLDVT